MKYVKLYTRWTPTHEAPVILYLELSLYQSTLYLQMNVRTPFSRSASHAQKKRQDCERSLIYCGLLLHPLGCRVPMAQGYILTATANNPLILNFPGSAPA